MSEIRVLTLFGEEIIPEQINAVGRSRAAKKNKKEGEEASEKPAKKEKKAKAVEQENVTPEVLAEANEVVDINETTTADTNADAATTDTIEEIPAVEEKAAPAPKEKKTRTKPVAAEEAITTDGAILENWEGDKQYYSIGEVANLFNVKTSNIRFWTKQFAMKVRTTRKGDRLYTPAQVREIRTIYHLVKEKRYTIAGAKGKMKTQKNTAVQSMDVRASLLQLRNKLIALRNELM